MVRTADKAIDAFNLAKKKPVQQKVIVFVVPSKTRLGVVKIDVRFPYAGVIDSVYGCCSSIGEASTIIALEKCNQFAYDTTPQWDNVANLTIDGGERSTNTSAPIIITNKEVEENDHFRLNVLEVGNNISDITVEITINI